MGLGLLSVAGMVSGAGDAVTKTAQTALAGGIQSLLQREREDWEMKRLEKTQQFAREQTDVQEGYAAAREQRGYKAAEGLLATREAGEGARLDKSLTTQSADKAADRLSTEGIHTAERKSKEMLAREENALKKSYYDALAGYYGRRPAAGGKGTENAEDKKQKEYLESVTKPLIDNLSKQMEIADPDEKADIQDRIDHVIEEARRVANIDEMVTAPTAGIKDRFKPDGSPAPPAAKSSTPSSSSPATPSAKPATPSKDVPVEPTRPVMPRGQVEPERRKKIEKQQLDADVIAARKELEQQKIHGNRAAVTRAEQKLKELEARQAAGRP